MLFETPITVAYIKNWLLESLTLFLQPGIIFLIVLYAFMWFLGSYFKRVTDRMGGEPPDNKP